MQSDAKKTLEDYEVDDEEEKKVNFPDFDGEVKGSLKQEAKRRVRVFLGPYRENPLLESIRKALNASRVRKKIILLEKDQEICGLAVLLPAGSDFNKKLRGESLECQDFVNKRTWEIRAWGCAEMMNLFKRVSCGKNPYTSQLKLRSTISKVGEELSKEENVERVLADKKVSDEKINFPFLQLLAFKKSNEYTDFRSYRIITF